MNATLPIAPFEKDIVESIKNFPVTIIHGGTGSGKSTQTVQYILKAQREGLLLPSRLVVTQPRRLAARTVGARVADELGEKVGQTIGVRTSRDRVVGQNTQCLFATDGLALVREVLGGAREKILVIDEIHEFNENIEVLIAWTKDRYKRGAQFKLICMSATNDDEALAKFYGQANIIKIPGRLYPIEKRRASPEAVVSTTVSLANQGRNVLVFVQGKKEIEMTIADLKSWKLKAEILPLHGELMPDEQQLCFNHYPQGKVVVATNVAQSSITIDDIDAVVDSGLEKRPELVDGIEGLYEDVISLADQDQRAGRAGRCKEGIYVNCAPNDVEPEKYPKPEILRRRIDQTILRLAMAGYDMEELEFFHQPDKKQIAADKKTIRALGCIDAEGNVTPIGRRCASMPCSVKVARMIVEGETLNVPLEEIVTAAAILEEGEVTARRDRNGHEVDHLWRPLCAGVTHSDVIAQMRCYKAATEMNKEEMEKNGIHRKQFFKIKDKRKLLLESLRGRGARAGDEGKDATDEKPETEDLFRDSNILRAICAGMVDNLFRSGSVSLLGTGGGGRLWLDADGRSWELNKNSVVTFKGQWAVGKPFLLEIPVRGGKKTLSLLQMVSIADPNILMAAAPHLKKVETGLNPYYDDSNDTVISTRTRYFNGHLLDSQQVPDPEHPQAAEVFADWLADEILKG